MSVLGTTMGFIYMYPLVTKFGTIGFDYTSLFMERENLDKILRKIEELAKNSDKIKRGEKRTIDVRKLFNRIKEYIKAIGSIY